MKTAGTKIFVAIFFIFISSFCSLRATITLRDASQKINETPITAPLRVFAPLLSGKGMIIGATAPGMKENSLIVINKQSYHGIVADKVMVNYKEESDNPLYDKQVALLTAQPLGSHPIVVTATEPKNLYMVQHYQSAKTHNILSLENIKDSANKDSNGILALTAAPALFIFAAVLGNESTQFGDAGSGVSVVWIKETENENKVRVSELVQLDTLKEDPKPQTEQEKKENSEKKEEPAPIENKTPRAVSLDRTSSALKINHDLAHIENAIDMVWEPKLDALYVALQLRNANASDAGACAIAVIRRVGTEKFMAVPLAPSSVFTSGQQNEIIGSLAPNAYTSIHKICVMHNSAELPYLIILGGNGTPAETRRTVHALPLYAKFSDRGTSHFGQLAKKDSSALTFYPTQGNPSHYLRYFEAPAQTPADILTSHDPAALIGGGPLKEGNIDTIIVHRDLACATVSSADVGYEPGIFFSRALLDESGIITNWTQWQRMDGITDSVFGATLNEADDSIMFFADNTIEQKLEIKQTAWVNDSEQRPSALEKIINEQFPLGITNMTDFPADLNAGHGPIFAILGKDKLALIKTGHIKNGVVIAAANQNFETMPTQYLNGCIDDVASPEASIIIFAGEALKQIAPLTSIEFVRNATQEWIMVGGAKGLALLCDKNGNGFLLKEKSDNLFASLRVGMQFKKISPHRFVRKIISDRDRAYILTDRTLERIDLSDEIFASDEIAPTTLVSTKSLIERGAFFDMIISEKLALIGTSDGLFRIGNNRDIATVQSADDAEWRRIFLPETLGAITQLEAHSTSGKMQDVSRSTGGMLYALDSCHGKNKSRIHRIAIKSTEGDTPVDNKTVISAVDAYTGRNNMSHVTLSTFRKKIVTDGALLLSFPNSEKHKPCIISGGKMRGHVNDIIDLPCAEGEIEALVRESASGRWFVGGSFGLLIHE